MSQASASSCPDSGTYLTWLALSAQVTRTAYACQAPTGWSCPSAWLVDMDWPEVEATATSQKSQGYTIQSAGIVVYSDRRVNISPDGKHHWCADQAGVGAGDTIRLPVPPRDF